MSAGVYDAGQEWFNRLWREAMSGQPAPEDEIRRVEAEAEDDTISTDKWPNDKWPIAPDSGCYDPEPIARREEDLFPLQEVLKQNTGVYADVWEYSAVTVAFDSEGRFAKLLSEGWEPFAVTSEAPAAPSGTFGSFGLTTIHMRRKTGKRVRTHDG
jgi:hypothetical protein